MNAAAELQKAVFGALGGDTALVAMLGRQQDPRPRAGQCGVSLRHLRPHQRLRLEHRHRKRHRATVHAARLVEGKGQGGNAGDHGASCASCCTTPALTLGDSHQLVNLQARIRRGALRRRPLASIMALLRFRRGDRAVGLTRSRRLRSRRATYIHQETDMVAQKGKDLLLKIDSTGSGSFRHRRRIALEAHRLQQRDGRHHRRRIRPAAGASCWPAAACSAHRSAARASSRMRSPTRRSEARFFAGADRGLAAGRAGFRHDRRAVPDHRARIYRQPRRRGDVRDGAGIGRACSPSRRCHEREPAARRDRGRTRRQAILLCLTLGALAELEAAYAVDDLGALVERFRRGRLSAAT